MQLKDITSLAFLGQSALVAAIPQQGATTSSASLSCQPHGDHWHCPSGVPEPTTKPASPSGTHDHHHDDDNTSSQSTLSNGCKPHNDHWHCPSGVPKPTYPPPGYTKPVSSSAPSASKTPTGAAVTTSAPTTGPTTAPSSAPASTPKPTSTQGPSTAGASQTTFGFAIMAAALTTAIFGVMLL